MFFKPQNLRRIDAESKPHFKIRLGDSTTLILIKGSGEARYGRTRADKDQIVEEFDNETDLLLWAWVGAHHTDIFRLTREDLNLYYR